MSIDIAPHKLSLGLSSFYELAFSFQLQYAKEAQTVCQIIQLRICKYGDPDTGTLTTQKKDTAFNQIVKYAFVVDNE